MKRLTWLAALLWAAPATAQVTALVGGTLIDGTLARADRRQRGADRAASASRPSDGWASWRCPPGATVISTEGMSVLPGLWDMHVHLMINGHADYDALGQDLPVAASERDHARVAAKQLLLAGVTSARDLGAPLEDSIAVREAIAAGRSRGRRLRLRSVHPARAVPGHRGVPLGRQRRRRRARQGAEAGRRRRRRRSS